ncbi:hypothetical protein AB6A40_009538 [Gnathostoma spinigerum]|uniref:Myosin motor domain-containing protein n=1 Tax=Gnathostoma spinigerum TaxID=75299 RepID=A0ABD6ES91_9BILA
MIDLRPQQIMMNTASKGDFVWIEPIHKTPYSTLTGARVLDVTSDGRMRVIDGNDEEQWLSMEKRPMLMHPTCVQGVEDMIQLGDLAEYGVLRNLFVRYQHKLIYTYIGSILVAVNPYTNLLLYTADQIRLYRNHRIGELPPHIFAIADNILNNMRQRSRDQCVILSGESGAGKTESAKLITQFLATVSGQHSWIEQQILEANSILEAFGHAKTVCNDNSSRFGKFLDVHFNGDGCIESANIECYLLEKSRIVHQSPGDRNYHIFYCLLAGISREESEALHLKSATHYYYLTQVFSVFQSVSLLRADIIVMSLPI